MATFHLTVARVGENLFDGDALSITLPATEGEVTILANHEAFVSPLKKGKAIIKAADNTKQEIEIENGVVEVSRNQTTVLL